MPNKLREFTWAIACIALIVFTMIGLRYAQRVFGYILFLDFFVCMLSGSVVGMLFLLTDILRFGFPCHAIACLFYGMVGAVLCFAAVVVSFMFFKVGLVGQIATMLELCVGIIGGCLVNILMRDYPHPQAR